MKFIDQAFITVRSGKGGHGAVHFRREKFVPRGGPDGGDGGRGGDVWLVASNRARSLYDYHHRRMHRAEDGRPGADKGSTGRSGAHLELTVPPGTQVFDEDSGELLADLTDDVEPEEALVTLRRELAAFDPALAERPSVVTLNKVDVLGPDAPEATTDLEAAIGEPVVPISAATGDGVTGWLDRVTAALPKVAPKLKVQASAVYDPLAE